MVLRKRATGADSGRRLTREGALLDAARHPGVVQVVRRSGVGASTELDLAWAGPRSLASQPRLPISEVAGLATALATTVADLHDLGIVHGRVVPEHVLVGADGRPVLCGFSEAVMPGIDGGCAAAPGDDVAAIGSLVSWLAGSDSEIEPIPEHRWWRGRRWDGYQRRALLNLADHAGDAAPDRRPSARALADAITTAVPSARLPIDRSPIATEDGAAAIAAGREALRPGTPAGAPGRLRRAREPETVTARPLHEPTPAPERRAGSDGGRSPWSSTPNERAAQPATSPRPTSPDRDDSRETGPAHLPVVGSLSAIDEATDIPLAAESSSRRHVGADRFADAESAMAEGRPVMRRRRLALGGFAAGLVLVSIFAFGVLADGGDGAARELPSSAPSRDAATRRPGDSPCPTVVGPRADADGDGCAELVVAHGRRVRVGDRSFLVGETGDRVAVGDWDCDGTATPAVLRLGTGAIYTFAGWPKGGALPPATLVASVEQAIDIHHRTGPSPGCPVLVIDRRDQPARVLDLGAGR